MDLIVESTEESLTPLWDQLYEDDNSLPPLKEILEAIREISTKTAAEVVARDMPEEDLDYLIKIYEDNPRLTELADKQLKLSRTTQRLAKGRIETLFKSLN